MVAMIVLLDVLLVSHLRLPREPRARAQPAAVERGPGAAQRGPPGDDVLSAGLRHPEHHVRGVPVLVRGRHVRRQLDVRLDGRRPVRERVARHGARAPANRADRPYPHAVHRVRRDRLALTRLRPGEHPLAGAHLRLARGPHVRPAPARLHGLRRAHLAAGHADLCAEPRLNHLLRLRPHLRRPHRWLPLSARRAAHFLQTLRWPRRPLLRALPTRALRAPPSAAPPRRRPRRSRSRLRYRSRRRALRPAESRRHTRTTQADRIAGAS